MHDDKSAGADQKITHFRESYLIASKNKDIENDISVNNSFQERIVIFFGIDKISQILALA